MMIWHYITTFASRKDLERHPILSDCGVQILRPVVAFSTKGGKPCSICDSAYDDSIFVPDKRFTYAVRENE